MNKLMETQNDLYLDMQCNFDNSDIIGWKHDMISFGFSLIFIVYEEEAYERIKWLAENEVPYNRIVVLPKNFGVLDWIKLERTDFNMGVWL